MALNAGFIETLLPIIDMVKRRPQSETIKPVLMSVGYPDLISSNSFLPEKQKTRFETFVDNNPLSMKWHGLDPNTHTSYSLEKICFSNSLSFRYLDINSGSGGDRKGFIKLDLNCDMPPDLYSSCDILIDSGTAEHCFNIGKVIENYYHLLRPNGILIQYIPFLSPNHGFWSANPTVVYDLASCNPIKILKCELQAYADYSHYFSTAPQIIPHSPTGRFRLPSGLANIEVILLFFVYKKLAKSMFNFPNQAKYRRLLSS